MENERVILLSEITSENMQTREWNVGSNLTERESECKSKITYCQIFIDFSISGVPELKTKDVWDRTGADWNVH